MPLTPEQAAELGLLPLEQAPAAPRKALSAAQAKALGLPDPRNLPDPGKALSFARGATQGAQLGFGDEIEGAVQAAGRKFLPDSLGGGSEADRRKSFMDLYRESRNVSRGENDAARQHHPALYGAGEVVGGVAPAVLTSAAMVPAGPAYGVVEKLAKAKGLLATGAAMGGASALGASEGEPGQMAVDTAKGAGIGAALVPVGALVERGATAAAGPLRDLAVRMGRKVLVGKQNSLSAVKPVADAAVQEALDVGAIKLFGTTKGAAGRLDTALETAGDQYRRIVAALEAKGITGPDAQALAQSIAEVGKSVARGTLNRDVPAVYAQAAEDLPTKAAGPMLPLSQAESLKQSLQHRAKYDRLAPSDVNDARKDVASMLRQANENAIASQAPGAGPEAQAIAAQFVPVKQQFGRLAEAERVAEAGANRIANRAGPNLIDAIHMAGATTAPGKLAAKILSKTYRERGPSTLAYGADRAANLVEWLTMKNGAPPTSEQLLMELLRRGGARSLSDRVAEGQ